MLSRESEIDREFQDRAPSTGASGTVEPAQPSAQAQSAAQPRVRFAAQPSRRAFQAARTGTFPSTAVKTDFHLHQSPISYAMFQGLSD
jgi:hypothetical protein